MINSLTNSNNMSQELPVVYRTNEDTMTSPGMEYEYVDVKCEGNIPSPTSGSSLQSKINCPAFCNGLKEGEHDDPRTYDNEEVKKNTRKYMKFKRMFGCVGITTAIVVAALVGTTVFVMTSGRNGTESQDGIRKTTSGDTSGVTMEM